MLYSISMNEMVDDETVKRILEEAAKKKVPVDDSEPVVDPKVIKENIKKKGDLSDKGEQEKK